MPLDELGGELARTAIAHGVEHVVGLSLGSIVALQVVLAAPRAFATLTLAAPALGGGPVEEDVGVRFRELIQLYAARGRGPWLTELWMREPPATFAYASAALAARLAATIDRHTWSELADPKLGISMYARQRQDATTLASSPARLLIVVGEHELPAFRQTALLLKEFRPDATIAELGGAGHLCILHAPAEAAALLAAHWRGDKKRSIPG